MAAARRTEVLLEVGVRRVFASAADWPGWSRSGQGEAPALEALVGYTARFAAVAALAHVRFPADAARHLEVVERVPGDATTDFGAPGKVAAADGRPLPAAEAGRQVRLLRAAWSELDRLAREAPPSLRKGPRGGGRDRDEVVRHVIEAERSYARMVGVRRPVPAPGDTAALEAAREELAHVLGAARTGEPLRERGWPARYALRRITWHVLDHVWEIEDKSDPG